MYCTCAEYSKFSFHFGQNFLKTQHLCPILSAIVVITTADVATQLSFFVHSLGRLWATQICSSGKNYVSLTMELSTRREISVSMASPIPQALFLLYFQRPPFHSPGLRFIYQDYLWQVRSL